MKTRKFSKPVVRDVTRPTPQPEVIAKTPPAPAAVEEKVTPITTLEPDVKRDQFGFFWTADGKDVDLDRMSRPSIEKMRQLFAAPSIKKNILKVEEAPGPEKKSEPVFPEFMVAKMYDALSMLEVAVSTRVFKVDLEVAERVLPFTEKEKSLLVPATATVLDKYSGDWLRTHRDEAFLITMLFTTFSAKIVQLRIQLSILEAQKKAALQRPSPPVTPAAPTEQTVKPDANGAAA